MDKSFSISDLASFEKLIAPKVLKIIYWIGLAGISVGCLLTFLSSFAVMGYDFVTGLGTMVVSVLLFVLGVLFWRVMIEMYMTFFGIYERLGDIRDGLNK